MSLIDDIKRDRAAAQCYGFHWIGETLMALDFGEVVELFAADWSGLDECEAENKRRIARVPDMEQQILADADRIEALQARVAELGEQNKYTLHTLDAWFDRRKLAHEAVDDAVVNAAAGYLRTSRNGGMPQEESDLVLGVIRDMARLSVFADLFARAALKEATK